MMKRRFNTILIPVGGPASRAFSLVEMMVAMVIISILATLSAGIFRVTMDMREIAERKIEVNEVARTALDLMSEELRAAYLAPESMAPVLSGRETIPRLRLAGIHHDAALVKNAANGANSPGADIDEDDDERIDGDDEESLDGLDNDQDGFTDEDYGQFPNDILHFVRLVESDGVNLSLEEVSYGLNERGTRLIRRGRHFTSTDLQSSSIQVGTFNEGGLPLLPALVATANADGTPRMQSQTISGPVYVNNWQDKTDDESLGPNMAILAYDIRGLRFTYWYYDYNRGGYRSSLEWDSARETCFSQFPANLFRMPAYSDSSAANATQDMREFGKRGLQFPLQICNESEDRLPQTRMGNLLKFVYPTYQSLLSASELSSEAGQVSRCTGKHTDGLPVFVEITIYVQDRDQTLPPSQFKTRVYLPNQNVGV